MANIESAKIRVNYFVNGLLAQGGEVRIENANLVFSPTSSLDRAMGASDIAISLKSIRGLSHSGSLLRTLLIKTDEKIFKFEGAQAKDMATMLAKALQQHGLASNVKVVKKSAPTSALACPKCQKGIRADFAFCPYCTTRLKAICHHCQKPTENNWIVCAYCGRSRKSAAA